MALVWGPVWNVQEIRIKSLIRTKRMKGDWRGSGGPGRDFGFYSKYNGKPLIVFKIGNVFILDC